MKNLDYETLRKLNNDAEKINLGKNKYIQVKDATLAFRKVFPTGQIKTEMLDLTDNRVVMCVSLYDDAGNFLSNGHAMEEITVTDRDGNTETDRINATSYVENCETSALGRALKNIGIGLLNLDDPYLKTLPIETKKYDKKTGKKTVETKQYCTIDERKKGLFLSKDFSDARIITKMSNLKNNSVIFQAQIISADGSIIYGTGTAMEVQSTSLVNERNYLENCESSAIGRALAACGIGIEASYASYEEVIQSIRKQENQNTVEFKRILENQKNNPSVPDPSQPEPVKKEETINKIQNDQKKEIPQPEKIVSKQVLPDALTNEQFDVIRCLKGLLEDDYVILSEYAISQKPALDVKSMTENEISGFIHSNISVLEGQEIDFSKNLPTNKFLSEDVQTICNFLNENINSENGNFNFTYDKENESIKASFSTLQMHKKQQMQL